jgi:hypothetical protein
LQVYVFLITPPFLIAGAAGYYLCFVRRKIRSFYPFLLVVVPAGIDLIAAIVVGFSWLGSLEGQASVIVGETDKNYFGRLETLRNVAVGLGPGYWIAVFEFVLVAVFFVLLYLRSFDLNGEFIWTPSAALVRSC